MKKGSFCLICFVFIVGLTMIIPASTVLAAAEPAFQAINITSLNNSHVIIEFNEKVYAGVKGKEKLSTADLDVSISGGKATLAGYYAFQLARDEAVIVLNLDGQADGSEVLKVKPAGANRIYNKAAAAMKADAEISINLKDMTPPRLFEGYPYLDKRTTDSVDLKIKSNEDGRAYYVVTGKDSRSPAYLQLRFGYIWHGHGWGPAGNNRKGSLELNAGQESSARISGLAADSSYDLYMVVIDRAWNPDSVKKLEITPLTSKNSQASVSSPSYTVNDENNSISGVVYGTSLADFKLNLIPAAGASFDIYQKDGSTVATDLNNGYKVKVTAENGVSKKEYVIIIGDIPILSSAKEIKSFGLVNPEIQGTISGNKVLLVVPYKTSLGNLIADFTLSPGASAYIGGIPQKSGVSSNDFTSPLCYTVKAEDDSQKTWEITVINELQLLSNAVLVGKHLFQIEDSNSLSYANVMAAMDTGNNLHFKSTNGRWYNLYDVNSIEDFDDISKAMPENEENQLDIQKWYKTGNEVEEFQ